MNIKPWNAAMDRAWFWTEVYCRTGEEWSRKVANFWTELARSMIIKKAMQEAHAILAPENI